MAAKHTVPVITYEPMKLLEARKISVDDPLRWLGEGWATFRRMPTPSLVFGSTFAIAGAAISWAGLSNPQLVFAFWSGFLLIGPILAMVLYRMARREETGSHPNFASCRQFLMQKPGVSLLFALLLSLIMIAWIRTSTLIAALYAGGITQSSSFITQMGTAEGMGFVALLMATGAVFAMLTFALSAWSLPMLIDERTDIIPAIASSVHAVFSQPLPMLIWGLLVAALTLVGMLTFFIGFAVLFPVLSYATWHAYRDLFSQ